MGIEDRRASINNSTLPLLLAQGPDVSTREIARAAGVAEGTIFRAFETKQDLIHATVVAALQPDAAIAQLGDLPAGQTLTERVATILDVLRAEIQRKRALFVHFAQSSAPPPPHHHGPPGLGPQDARVRLSAAIADALAPYADQLSVPTDLAAQVLSALAFATITLAADAPFNQSVAIADVVLHGICGGEK
jgi:AcrR family transcriptional regulator